MGAPFRSGPPGRHRKRRPLRRSLLGVVLAFLVPLTSVVALATTTGTAAAAPSASGVVDPLTGFPTWYQDAAGNRVEMCADPADANCVLAPSVTFNPGDPVTFPGNFPDEAFYALADSSLITTPGCAGTAPGRASVRLALEGAFATPNGGAAPGQQLVFGRIRVKVTSGLCPNTTYQFRHPFGVETFTTNALGGVPANVGTEDVGCLARGPLPCDFTKATASRVFGTAANGFLRWDPAANPPAPAGYLGDGATPHTITGGTAGNTFDILNGAGGDLGLSTNQFVVAGKLAGSLSAPAADFGGQDVGTTSPVRTVTVTNLDSTSVTVGAPTLPAGSAFAIAPGGTCAGAVLARDASCTILTTFAPTAFGRQTAPLVVPSTGGVRSPLTVTLSGNGTASGTVADIGFAPTSVAFANTRVRVVSPIQNVTVTNTGTAPLRVGSVAFDRSTGSGANHYRIVSNTCLASTTVDPGATCTVGIAFAPLTIGAHPATLVLTANTVGSPHRVAVTGTGIGGVAAVSPTTNPANGFPDWYRDEAGVKVAQCIDPADPHCVVLPDATFNPANPVAFPSNFPGEFFYQVATSNVMDTPGCLGSAPGRALFRSAAEGSFVGGVPVPGNQITFGRIRISVTGGLCPDTTYTVTSPYGADTFTTNGAGAIPRNAGTDDTGCFPVSPAVCDYSLALPSRVLGGLLKWDPAVAPAAPAGYLGDAITPHKVVGAPFSADGLTPANFVSITAPDGTEVARTDQFTVMGKLQGPLEANPGDVDFGVVPVGSTSAAQTVTFSNTGIAPITIASSALGGPNAAETAIAGDTCTGTTLAVGATCTVGVSFAPTATGVRNAALTLTHDGANSPFSVPLAGTGGAAGGTAAISFVPTAVAFGPQHVNTTSAVQTVTVSNAGGTNPLSVGTVALGGPGAAHYAIVGETCTAAPIAPGATCTVDVAFTPTTAGAKAATIVVTDNAPGGTHTATLSGTGSAANPAVSPGVDSQHGFPQYYQDGTGTRVAPCLEAADPTCVVLADAGFNPANPLVFPTNFPSEFFYSLADSELVPTDGCGGTTPPGTAMMRAALEGSFVTGAPVAGDQITFGRIRIAVTSGLCPNTPYVFQTPYGPQNYTTDAGGGIPRNAGTTQVGCAAAPCAFGDALAAPVAASYLRWDPGVAPAAPAGRLGDPTVLHRVVGGTAVGGGRAINAFSINALAGNVSGATDRFRVVGKGAGPLGASVSSLDFGHQGSGTVSGTRTATLTNVTGAALPISAVALTGPDAGQFRTTGGTCAGTTVAADATCTVVLAFAPTTTGVKNAALTVTPATGAALSVALTGAGDPAPAPVASVTPGVLSYGTVTAGSPATLSTTVRNTGTGNLVIAGTAITGAGAADYTVTSPACGSIAPAATCTISVRFAPTATGSRPGSLVITHNATGGSTTVSLTGTGSGSTFTLSPSPIGVGTTGINTTKTQSVSVKNSGTVGFTLGAASFSGAQAAAFGVTGPGCLGTVLAPGKSCTITVSFRPTAAIAYAADLKVNGDGTSLPPSVTVRVTGTGK